MSNTTSQKQPGGPADPLERRKKDPDAISLIEKAGFPKHHIAQPIETLGQHKAWLKSAVTCDSALRTSNLACVFGGRQTGKTQMAVTIGRTRVYRNGHRCTYTALSRFITAYDGRERMHELIADMFYSPRLLILDDGHLCNPNQMHNSWLDALISQRMNDDLQTLLIYEAHGKSLRTYLPPGVAAKLDTNRGYIDCNWGPILKA